MKPNNRHFWVGYFVGNLAMIVAIIIFSVYFSSPSSGPGSSPPNLLTSETPAHTFEDLLDAIEWVESKGDANAIGDNGNAVGSFQIWKIYVDDCNRILGRKQFTYHDRFSRERSREMVRVYLPYYCPEGNFEKMAKVHNGGPTGHLKPSTAAYWLKVKARMETK